MDAQEVDGYAGESHADAHQGVDGVTVEGHEHQEDAAQAVDHGEEQVQLGGEEGHTGESIRHILIIGQDIEETIQSGLRKRK